jgi:hypothetical protein
MTSPNATDDIKPVTTATEDNIILPKNKDNIITDLYNIIIELKGNITILTTEIMDLKKDMKEVKQYINPIVPVVETPPVINNDPTPILPVEPTVVIFKKIKPKVIIKKVKEPEPEIIQEIITNVELEIEPEMVPQMVPEVVKEKPKYTYQERIQEITNNMENELIPYILGYGHPIHINIDMFFDRHIEYDQYFNNNKLGYERFIADMMIKEISKLDYDKRPIHFLKHKVALYNYEKNVWETHIYFGEELLKVITDVFYYIKKYTIDYIDFKNIPEIDDEDDQEIDDSDKETYTFIRQLLEIEIDNDIVMEEMLLILDINN